MFEDVVSSFISCASRWGLTVSVQKSKGMAIGASVDCRHVAVGGDTIEVVDKFPYLGSLLSSDGLASRDVASRVAKASAVFGALRIPVFANKTLSSGVRGVCMRLWYCQHCFMELKPGQLKPVIFVS